MSAVLNYIVSEKNSGKTIEKILKSEYGISSGLMTELKYNGRLRLNGEVCKSVDIAATGDLICADVSEDLRQDSKFNRYRMELDILFEDEFLIVVNKPGGIASHPCPSNREETLANGIMYYWDRKGEYHNYHIVNRLDKDTSGICVIAKNRFAHGVLSQQMKNNMFKKTYSAIVRGVPFPEDGTIEMPIKRAKGSVIKREASLDGKYAKTIYKLTQTSNNKQFSHVEINLETGRTHQIRVHFLYIGHPLVGDWLYGDGDNERHLINRHALHARKIEFFHPATKEKLMFITDIPDEMKKLLKL